jgi:hypothetical protein
VKPSFRVLKYAIVKELVAIFYSELEWLLGSQQRVHCFVFSTTMVVNGIRIEGELDELSPVDFLLVSS